MAGDAPAATDATDGDNVLATAVEEAAEILRVYYLWGALQALTKRAVENDSGN